VQCFLESESCPDDTKTKKHAKFGVGLRTVGVRVKCQGEKQDAAVKQSRVNQSDEVPRDNESDEDEDESQSETKNEEDELIWWSWDGKLTGFTD
jgi:hypothetical protein